MYRNISGFGRAARTRLLRLNDTPNWALCIPPRHRSYSAFFLNNTYVDTNFREKSQCGKKSAKVLQLLEIKIVLAGGTVKSICYSVMQKQRTILSNPLFPISTPLSSPSPIPPISFLVSLIITTGNNKAAFSKDRES
jgi:hypothetical protein